MWRSNIMDEKKDWNLELFEYIKQGEPDKAQRTKAWETAIGLQDVDGLQPSKYLIETAKQHIEGTIDIDEVKDRINQYYEALDSRKDTEKENEEADINMCFDSTGLIPGKYYIVLGTFDKNQFGTYTDIDVVENAFGFEIKDEENALGIVWLRKFWGHMKLNDITIEQ